MKIIITESQHILKRRLEMFVPVVYQVMRREDPCNYGNFERYKINMLFETIYIINKREGFLKEFPSDRSYKDFMENILSPFLHDIIKEYYDSCVGKCKFKL